MILSFAHVLLLSMIEFLPLILLIIVYVMTNYIIANGGNWVINNDGNSKYW